MTFSRDILIRIIKEQNKVAKQKLRKYVPREVEKIILAEQKNKNFVVILSGVRRAGKSTLLTHLRTKYYKSNYYINFDDDRLVCFTAKDLQLLLEIFIQLYGRNKYVFLDEVQNVEGWERFVNRLKEQGYKVFVTGSNSRLLSKEFGTFLTGRYVEYKIYPFSFSEFLQFYGVNVNEIKKKIKESALNTEEKATILRLFDQYLIYGGLPEFLKTKDLEFLKTLYESIIYKDIIARYDIKSDNVLRQLANIAAGNFAKTISFRSYKNLGVKSSSTIAQYFEYMVSSYLFFLLPKFFYSIRSQVLARKKLYVIDNALAGYIGFRPTQDKGRFFENLIFLHLIRKQTKQLFYYADSVTGNKSHECDFVVLTKTLEYRYIDLIQVTLHLNKVNYSREVGGIVDAYIYFKQSGHDIKNLYILTYDTKKDIAIELDKVGRIHVKVVPAWEFLLTN